LTIALSKSGLNQLISGASGEIAMDTIWQGVSNRLREQLGRVGFETWIAPLSFIGIEGRIATLQAPNKFFRDWVNDRYLNELRKCLSAETGAEVEIALVPPPGDDGKQAVVRREPISPRPGAFQTAPSAPAGHSKLDPRYAFDGFVVGASNQFAHAAAMAVAKQPGEKYNPLFLYGAVGLGKTHLATAIGHHLCASDRGRNVVFAPAELFMNELISSLRRDRMGEFKDKMRRVDVLILDDVHFVAGRERTQEEFFHTFNSLHAERHQIVLTSDKPPRDLTGLEERLRNRFESGLIADIAPPDLETRIAILQKKAAAENLTLDAEVALFVAQSVSSNVRELEGCFNRLAALASLTKGAITLDFARESLRGLVRDAEIKPDIETIQQHVSDVFHIRLADLKSKKRTQHVAFCRQVAMYLCRKLTDSSFPVIGTGFGRDHSTVIHAYNLIAHRVNKDAAFSGLIQKIERQLKIPRSNPPDHEQSQSEVPAQPLSVQARL
jgi:chromosomal replication initiator protein